MALDVGPPDPWFHPPPSGGGAPPPPPPSAGGFAGGGVPDLTWLNPPPTVDAAGASLGAPTGAGYTFTPDYGSLINQYISPYQSLQDQQLAAMQAAQDRQAGFAKDAYGINAAGYKEAHGDALRTIVNSLAARGMLQSGDRGWLRAKENRRYGRQTGLAANSLAAYLAGLAASMQQARFSSQSALEQQRLALSQWLPQAFPVVSHTIF